MQFPPIFVGVRARVKMFLASVQQIMIRALVKAPECRGGEIPMQSSRMLCGGLACYC